MSDCTWCLNARKAEVPGGFVALFVCGHEHMAARPLCADCAETARQPMGYYCPECDDEDSPSAIDLVCTREAWMRMLDEGRVRFARSAVSGD